MVTLWSVNHKPLFRNWFCFVMQILASWRHTFEEVNLFLIWRRCRCRSFATFFAHSLCNFLVALWLMMIIMVRKTITMHTCGLFDPSQHQITIVGVFPQLPHSQHIKARNNLILSSWQLNHSKISYSNSFDLNISVLRFWLALKAGFKIRHFEKNSRGKKLNISR